MSSASSNETSIIIQSLNELLSLNYCQVASSALIVYEHFMNLFDEVHFVWQYQMTATTFLLLMNRYMLLINGIWSAVMIFNTNPSPGCRTTLVLIDIVNTIPSLIVAGFSALCVFAISGREILLAIAALLTGLVPAAANIYVSTAVSNLTTSYYYGIELCSYTPTVPESASAALGVVSPLCAIFSDAVVIYTTWRDTLSLTRRTMRSQTHTGPLALFIQEGTGYYVVLLLISIWQLVSNQVSALDSISANVTVFSSTLANVLISRFMFNLRRISTVTTRGNGTESEHLSTGTGESIRFASRLAGNIGYPRIIRSAEVTSESSDDVVEIVGLSHLVEEIELNRVGNH